jgi:hypothetical protein
MNLWTTGDICHEPAAPRSRADLEAVVTPRSVTRGCAGLGLAGLGLVLWSGPAFALDLPSAPPVLQAPAPVSSLLPDPVASLVPAPVASALDPITSKLPGASPSPTATPKPTPAPRAQQPHHATQQQQARSVSAVAQLPATLALRAGRAELQDLPGVVAPVAVAPMPVTPALAPAAAAPASLPAPSSPDGLPALVVAVAFGAVSAAAAGQVAEMHARRGAAV